MIEDLKKSLLEMDKIEAQFLVQQINRIINKNKYRLLTDRDGTFTPLGEIVAGLSELVFVYAVMKYDSKKETVDEEGA